MAIKETKRGQRRKKHIPKAVPETIISSIGPSGRTAGFGSEILLPDARPSLPKKEPVLDEDGGVRVEVE